MKFRLQQKFLGALALAAVLAASPGGPARAQEGVLVKDLLGRLGVIPDEGKDPIDYRERPALVLPKDMGKLRQPEETGLHAKSPQWPADPDIAAREAAKAKRSQVGFINERLDGKGERKLTLDELAAGRVARGTPLGETTNPVNDRVSHRLSIQQMEALNKVTSEPTIPKGTEPPRRYLTDPPVGLRVPSANAPIGQGRPEARTSVSDKEEARPLKPGEF